MKERSTLTRILVGPATGAAVAVGVSWFAGTAYREGDLLAPLAALALAMAAPFLLYEEPAKRVTFALLTSALLSVLSLLAISLGGQASGPTVFGLSIVAIAVPVGADLIMQDFGTRLRVSPFFSYGAAVMFLVAALPLSARLIVYEHQIAVEEDDALIRTVAQNVRPQGNTIVFDQISPQQKEKLKKLVSVRTKEKTYSLSDAEVESVVEERTVRRESRKQPQSAVVSREQAERMRMILSLQGAPVPNDITLFSRRGPITTSELTVALEEKNPG
jgi:hypothetical protein